MCSFIALPRISSGGRVASPGKTSIPQVAQLLSTQVCGVLSGQLSLQWERCGGRRKGWCLKDFLKHASGKVLSPVSV